MFVTQFGAPGPVLGYPVQPRPITGSTCLTQNPTQSGLGLGWVWVLLGRAEDYLRGSPDLAPAPLGLGGGC